MTPAGSWVSTLAEPSRMSSHSHAGEPQRTASQGAPRAARGGSCGTALVAVGLDWTDVADLVHGTTLITNAIVEGRLAKVALITTAGFGDSLVIGRQNRRYLYRLDLPPKATPQVPEERRIELRERLDADGTVRPPSAHDLTDVDEQARALRRAEAIAVSLLHAYANPAHEEMSARALAKTAVPVACFTGESGSAGIRTHRDDRAERQRHAARRRTYLEQLERAVPDEQPSASLPFNGGMAALAALRDLPLGLALSGPARRRRSLQDCRRAEYRERDQPGYGRHDDGCLSDHAMAARKYRSTAASAIIPCASPWSLSTDPAPRRSIARGQFGRGRGRPGQRRRNPGTGLNAGPGDWTTRR